MKLGMIGLGKMGFGMSARLLQAGHDVVGFDPAADSRDRLVAEGGAAVSSLDDLVGALDAPRSIWMMVPSGAPVDQTLEALKGLLASGDVVVDGGNSNYKRTQARAAALAPAGITLVDVGTSGGVWGRAEGYCLMVGGDEEAVERLRPLLQALAADGDVSGEVATDAVAGDAASGWAHVGASGAGHFVKMVHNGVEYGLMQAYAEGFAILEGKQDLDLDLAQVAEVWRHGSVVRSWLLDLITLALEDGSELGEIEPWVADSGEGRWTVQEALDLDVPAPVISLALIERLTSRESDSFAHKMLAAMRQQFGGHAVRQTS